MGKKSLKHGKGRIIKMDDDIYEGILTHIAVVTMEMERDEKRLYDFVERKFDELSNSIKDNTAALIRMQ